MSADDQRATEQDRDHDLAGAPNSTEPLDGIDLYDPAAGTPSSLEWPAGPSHEEGTLPAPSPPRRGRGRRIAALVVSLAAVLLLAAGVGYLVWSPGSSPSSSGEIDALAIAQAVRPGLVNINVILGYQGLEGAGTGLLLSPGGEVLTNNHVITGATSISATDVGNGQTYVATVVGYDRTHDVAVIKLAGASGLTTNSLGNSSTVRVGDPVVVVGNAGGAGGTPRYAQGTVTGVDQSVTAQDTLNLTEEHLEGLIATNAFVQPGDSGGALVDKRADVVGMITAASIGFSLGDQTTTGYAVPINQASSIASQINAGESSATVHIGPTAFLGAAVQSTATGSGAQIIQLVAGGPADSAGLQNGDTIIALNGEKVSSPEALINLLIQQAPNTTVRIQYRDFAGQAHSVNVVLTTGPAQ